MRNWDVFGIFEYLTGLICIHATVIILLICGYNSNEDSKKEFVAVNELHVQVQEYKEELLVKCLCVHLLCFILQIYEAGMRFMSGKKARESVNKDINQSLMEGTAETLECFWEARGNFIVPVISTLCQICLYQCLILMEIYFFFYQYYKHLKTSPTYGLIYQLNHYDFAILFDIFMFCIQFVSCIQADAILCLTGRFTEAQQRSQDKIRAHGKLDDKRSDSKMKRLKIFFQLPLIMHIIFIVWSKA